MPCIVIGGVMGSKDLLISEEEFNALKEVYSYIKLLPCVKEMLKGYTGNITLCYDKERVFRLYNSIASMINTNYNESICKYLVDRGILNNSYFGIADGKVCAVITDMGSSGEGFFRVMETIDIIIPYSDVINIMSRVLQEGIVIDTIEFSSLLDYDYSMVSRLPNALLKHVEENKVSYLVGQEEYYSDKYGEFDFCRDLAPICLAGSSDFSWSSELNSGLLGIKLTPILSNMSDNTMISIDLSKGVITEYYLYEDCSMSIWDCSNSISNCIIFVKSLLSTVFNEDISNIYVLNSKPRFFRTHMYYDKWYITLY